MFFRARVVLEFSIAPVLAARSLTRKKTVFAPNPRFHAIGWLTCSVPEMGGHEDYVVGVLSCLLCTIRGSRHLPSRRQTKFRFSVHFAVVRGDHYLTICPFFLHRPQCCKCCKSFADHRNARPS